METRGNEFSWIGELFFINKSIVFFFKNKIVVGRKLNI